MTLNDPLSTALSKIMNAERIKKAQITIFPSSTIIQSVLQVFQDNHYLGNVSAMPSSRGTSFQVNLLGRINLCGAVKPRFSVKKTNYEKFEKRYLPAKDFGILIVSTPKGIMTHEQAKKLNIGGKILAYCY